MIFLVVIDFKEKAKAAPSSQDPKAPIKESSKPSAPLPKARPSNEVDIDIAKMVQQKTITGSSPTKTKRASEQPIILHIWDFAGHDLYYTTHQVCVDPATFIWFITHRFQIGMITCITVDSRYNEH